MGFCPQYLRADCGTENGIIAGVQCFFRISEDAHRYETSVSNQRIEDWWSHMRKGFTNWLIEFFKDLVNENIFIPDNQTHLAAIGIPIIYVNHDMILLLASQMFCFIY